MAETTSPDTRAAVPARGCGRTRPSSPCRNGAAAGGRLEPGRSAETAGPAQVGHADRAAVGRLPLRRGAASTWRRRSDGATQDFFSPATGPGSTRPSTCRSPRTGYTFTHCSGSRCTRRAAGVAPPAGRRCTRGSSALLGHLGLSLPVAGVMLSLLFAYLTLQVLWVLIGPSWTFSSLCCLAFAACFPGMIYYYALFPISLLTFLSVLCLLLFIRRRYVLAGLVGALCAWAFATGPLIGVVLLVAAVFVVRWPGLLARHGAQRPALPSPASVPCSWRGSGGWGIGAPISRPRRSTATACTTRSRRS